jgi:crotonobetainyl-CoA:carnitine CoA-transferase CaiB-like acyl-CoA transferase
VSPYQPPFAGVRVVEVTDESGVFAGRLLADLGFDVVRVEDPTGGSLRGLAPFAAGDPHVERSCVHLYLDAGKRSVVIDRTTEEGRAQLAALLASADVVIETERLDDAELRATNPRVVHVTITPFGLDTPWNDRVGSDLVGAASGGLAWVCGSPDDPPNQPAGDQAYKLAGLAAAAGAVIALTGVERHSAGVGVHLDISVQESVALSVLQTSNPSQWVWEHKLPKRPGMTGVHRCADGGWITLSVLPQRMRDFLGWVTEAGLADDDPETLNGAFGASAKGALKVRELAARYPRDEFMARAWNLDLMGLPVQTLADLADNDHLAAIDEFVPVDQASEVGLPPSILFPRSPLDGLGTVQLRRAPLLGEHTQDVLAERRDPAERPAAEGPRLDLSQALEGVRVVDFCWMIAGPLGTRILANFGADVLRVESGPRAYPDNFPAGVKDPSVGAFHNILNTAKRSITIDPRSDEGRSLLLELIAQADVVTNNYRPGVMERLGYDFETLKAANPRIISLHVPGCGRDGPWANVGTYGSMVSAAAGLSTLMGFPGRAPRGLGVAYPDFTSPFLMPLLLLGALRERDRTGEPREIELNQLSATIALIGTEWLQYTTSGVVPAPKANRDANWSPHGVFPSGVDDEWVAIGVRGDDQFRRLCGVVGRSEIADDGRFADHASRKANEDELDALVTSWTQTRTKWEAADALQAAGVPAAAVAHLADALTTDPQLRRHYQEIRQPSHPDIAIVTQGEPIQEAFAYRPVQRAPMYGEHTDQILRELLGRSEHEITALRDAGVIS